MKEIAPASSGTRQGRRNVGRRDGAEKSHDARNFEDTVGAKQPVVANGQLAVVEHAMLLGVLPENQTAHAVGAFRTVHQTIEGESPSRRTRLAAAVPPNPREVPAPSEISP